MQAICGKFTEGTILEGSLFFRHRLLRPFPHDDASTENRALSVVALSSVSVTNRMVEKCGSWVKDMISV